MSVAFSCASFVSKQEITQLLLILVMKTLFLKFCIISLATLSSASYAQSFSDVLNQKAQETKKQQDEALRKAEEERAKLEAAASIDKRAIPSTDAVPSSMLPAKPKHYNPYDWKMKEMQEQQYNSKPYLAPPPTIEAPVPEQSATAYRTLGEAAQAGINPLAEKAAEDSGSAGLNGMLQMVGLGFVLLIVAGAGFFFIKRKKSALQV